MSTKVKQFSQSDMRSDGTKEASSTHSPSDFSDLKRVKRLEAVHEDAPSKELLFRRVYDGKASPRLVIKAMCLECCWMDETAIRECEATACPLWNLRPYQIKSRARGLK